jgi:hypothetical protein
VTKTCGSCTVCCKLISVKELNKPAGTPCQHCNIGRGCAIYQDRPHSCRAWSCGWLVTPDMRDEYRPDRCGFVLMAPLTNGKALQLSVDWKRIREKPRLKNTMQKFVDAVTRSGTSVVWIAPDRKLRAVLAPGHTEQGLLQDIQAEAATGGTLMRLDA